MENQSNKIIDEKEAVAEREATVRKLYRMLRSWNLNATPDVLEDAMQDPDFPDVVVF